jgi:hypothetical protein
VAEQESTALNLADLRLFVADRVGPFFEPILKERRDLVLALHVIGSAVTDDFDPERSDINTMIVLKHMDLDFLDLLGALCHEMRHKRIGSPTLMTPRYIEQWLDVSPIELLDLQLVNRLVYGRDLFAELCLDREAVRLESKRELRNRLIMLSWGYVRASGNKAHLTELLVESVFMLAPLVRGILYAKGEEPPVMAAPLFDKLADLVGPAALSFKEVYWMKSHDTKLPVARVRDILKDYYRAIESLIDVVDSSVGSG